MSIVLRSRIDDGSPAILFCKGADSNMLNITDANNEEIQTVV